MLQPSNCIAYEAIYGTIPNVAVGQAQVPFRLDQFKQQAHYFADRLRRVQPKYRAFVREMYANPVVSKLSYAGENIPIAKTA